MSVEKNEVYIVTQVDRATPCIVGWDVVVEHSCETLQPILDRFPPAQRDYSDNLAVYDTLVYYPGHHLTVLRHHLARLVRRWRCFSRRMRAVCALSGPPSSSSSLPGIAARYTGAATQPVLPMSRISCTRDVVHSPHARAVEF